MKTTYWIILPWEKKENINYIPIYPIRVKLRGDSSYLKLSLYLMIMYLVMFIGDVAWVVDANSYNCSSMTKCLLCLVGCCKQVKKCPICLDTVKLKFLHFHTFEAETLYAVCMLFLAPTDPLSNNWLLLTSLSNTTLKFAWKIIQTFWICRQLCRYVGDLNRIKHQSCCGSKFCVGNVYLLVHLELARYCKQDDSYK